jgi:hypothetical protein
LEIYNEFLLLVDDHRIEEAKFPQGFSVLNLPTIRHTKY